MNQAQLLNALLSPPAQDDPLFFKSWIKNFSGSWLEHIKEIPEQAVCLFGYPSDSGSIYVRGAADGPDAIRKALFQSPAFDLGNLNIIPQFLSDEMLNEAQITASREEIYADLSPEDRVELPVSPYEMCMKMVDVILEIRPDMKFLMLGGDQSGSAAVISSLSKVHKNLGLIHFDAHSDAQEHYFGIKHSSGTWIHQIKQAHLAPSNIIQIGIKDTGLDKLNHAIITGKQALQTPPKRFAEECINYLVQQGVEKVYLSNDISCTDSSIAPACGHTSPNGLYPHHINTVIEAVAKSDLEIVGSDLMEVAPRIGTGPGSMSTCRNAAQYVRKQVESMTI